MAVITEREREIENERERQGEGERERERYMGMFVRIIFNIRSYIHKYLETCKYRYIYIYMYIYTYIYIVVYMYICIYISTYVYPCIFEYTCTFSHRPAMYLLLTIQVVQVRALASADVTLRYTALHCITLQHTIGSSSFKSFEFTHW